MCATGRDIFWHHAECNVPSEWDTPSIAVLDLVALLRAWSFQLSCTSESKKSGGKTLLYVIEEER